MVSSHTGVAGEPREDPAAVDPDLAVLERVAVGDGEAFEALVERHQDRILALCERLLGNPEDARDGAQEVFLKVYRQAGSFTPRGRVGTWIYRIAVNHCLNLLRRRRLVRFLPLAASGDRPETEGPWSDPPAPAPGPEETAADRLRWQRTRRAIVALPPSQRAVLVLARFERLSHREIAETLGITVGAVESRLFRALRRLEGAR
jgi:RNA polymerase sigma-70 factor (ECF subfamily)